MNCVSLSSGICLNTSSGIDVPTVQQCEACLLLIPKPAQSAYQETDTPFEPVGTVLKELIMRAAPVRMRHTCGCESLAAEMDAWGVDGCRLRKEHIVSRMVLNRGVLVDGLKEGGKWWQPGFAALMPDVVLRTGAAWLLNQAIDDVDLRYKAKANQRQWALGPITPTRINRDRFVNRCVAITSLSPNPARAERQAYCLQSWRDIGLQVFAVNTAGEHESFSDAIQSIITPIISDDLTTAFDRPTQRVTALTNAGIQSGLPFVLINADVEMQGDHEAIEEALRLPDRLSIGVRYNYSGAGSKRMANRESAGLDAFVLSPEIASTIPTDSPYGIGKPVWDYWLPHHCRKARHVFHWLNEPFLFHEQHDVQWSVEEWNQGCEWFADRYGVVLEYGEREFRESLEVSI